MARVKYIAIPGNLTGHSIIHRIIRPKRLTFGGGKKGAGLWDGSHVKDSDFLPRGNVWLTWTSWEYANQKMMGRWFVNGL